MKFYYVYALKLKTPDHYYVGSTPVHRFEERMREHAVDFGCKWTQRHGVDSLVGKFKCLECMSNDLEQEVTAMFVRKYGLRGVRGGDINNTRADCYDNLSYWVPRKLRKYAPPRPC